MRNLELQYKDLDKAIISVIAFFDMFDYPLTSFEIWKYLGVEMSFQEIIDYLEKTLSAETDSRLRGNDKIEEKNGFYFLEGRSEIIQVRKEKYNYTDRKFKRALWVSKIFKFIPWIKGVAIGNLIGEHNLKNESDIDFFIITQKNRIWVTRFYCVLVVKFLGLRPTTKNSKDKICLSFFVSEERLDLKDLMMNTEEVEKETKFLRGNLVSKKYDIYFTHWLAGLIPIYDNENIFEKFFQENDWLKEYLPNWSPQKISFKRNVGKQPFTKVCHNLGGFRNLVCKKLQLKILPKGINDIMNKDTRVVINDQILKMHVNDRRAMYIDMYIDKISRL